ncbi:hypothetical protein BDP81DRAFT_398758 [Colletotrichum phormii]|uniref:Uncharacterized protein n=1 Tax=Colletotrichum phormii TaxID=359342 RepID=A0AAI9ZGQ7_9PEZI|nr:uncharacterized protein BDP81DRAFT_398758 [Colletotrichum phormii]KAK1624245.1 hypothetical protein BDP81DRAFT_398758 [Colletotrichum phormii]
MPWGVGTLYTVAITTSVILTTASQLASTFLLSDFAVVNVTAPQKTADMLYGNSYVKTPVIMQGTSIWKSKPWVYPRFAELRSRPGQQSDHHEDTGTILRAFIPFTNEPSRIRLRSYEGPTAVIDSRVVCVQPVISNVTFSAVAFDYLKHEQLDTYREVNVFGYFSIPEGDEQLPIDQNLPADDQDDLHQIGELKWSFNCVVPAEDIHGYSKDDPLASRIENFSICLIHRPWKQGCLCSVSFQDFRSLKIYIACILFYLLAAVAAVVWSYQGPAVDRDYYYMQRVFRTPDALKVDQLYSGIALSALLAPAGMLVQWIMHDFRHLRLFALTAQRPVLLADLDKIGDDSSAWTLRILGKYSWRYAVMQAALIVIRTSIVPVGTLMLTTGAFYDNITSVDVVGMPILPSDDSSVTRLANAMGWNGQGTFKQTLGDNDNFLSRTVYTFVGNIVSQSALVDVFSGVIVLYHWDANCEAATEIPFTTSLNGANASFTFTLPDSSNQTIDVTPRKQESQSLRLWNSAANTSINEVPIGGTTYFISAGPSSSLKAETLTNDSSLTQTAEGHWISRSKCTPEFSWEVGACTYNGTLMTDCVGNPGSNTTAIDTAALDVLKDYMTAIPWWIFREQLQIVDKTIDTLYAIPTAEDWGHFFGNIAQSIAAISTAGYFGTAIVPVVARVKEDVYIKRTVVLWIVLAMLGVVFSVSCLDIWRSKSRGLPFRAATFLAIANAVRGPWWDQELHGSCAADELTMQKRSSASVMFGVDANNSYSSWVVASGGATDSAG